MTEDSVSKSLSNFSKGITYLLGLGVLTYFGSQIAGNLSVNNIQESIRVGKVINSLELRTNKSINPTYTNIDYSTRITNSSSQL